MSGSGKGRDDESVAYDNVLSAAERFMNGVGGRCCTCDYFQELPCSSDVPERLKGPLEDFGLCMHDPAEPWLVDRASRHEWDDCWIRH